MRFIHTADWHVGLAAAHTGTAASRVREARLEAAQRVVQAASVHAAEFVIVAGDTFDHNTVSGTVVAEVAEIMRSAGCPLFVIPGNHDPLQPSSVWNHPAWSSTPNVRVLLERSPVPIAGGTLYPCPLTRKRSDEQPTAWIPSSGDGIRIAIAHGNAGEVFAEDGGHPIPIDLPQRLSLDYVALGHWHSTLEMVVSGATRIAYSGAPEASSFAERDSGNILLVDIREHGAVPELKRIHTGLLSFHVFEESITGPGKLVDLTRQLAMLPATESLVEVRLQGLLFERDRDELTRVREACRRFLHGRVNDSGLRPAPNDDGWVRGLPSGVIRETGEKLRAMATQGGPRSAAALQALLELYAIDSEVRQ